MTRDDFERASAANDHRTVITLAEAGLVLQRLSDTANIGVETLKRMGSGDIVPSKNQRRKILDAARALTI